MASSRVGFVTGIDSLWRHHLVAVKQGVHHFSGGLTPDVYALPRFLGESATFIRSGESIDRSAFDLLLSELNAGDSQLAYLESLVAAQPPPVAVIPGPPEILTRGLNHERLGAVQRILRGAHRVLVYAPELARFYDGLTGQARARVVPWPFDYAAVRDLGGTSTRRQGRAGTIHVLLNVPLRFGGVAQNYPFVLKAALLDAIAPVPAADRERLRFHTFVYEDRDRDAFEATRFAQGASIVLETRRPYGAFVRFLAACDAIVNITASSVLGRVTFLSAALGKPGLFSANAHLNAELYPSATVPLLQPGLLRDALSALIRGLLAGEAPPAFMPDDAAARRVGDFAANAAIFRRLVCES
jgi:hypothetical protein